MFDKMNDKESLTSQTHLRIQRLLFQFARSLILRLQTHTTLHYTLYYHLLDSLDLWVFEEDKKNSG